MAALSIRNLNDDVKRRLHLRAARHGRSMEAEIRSILEHAVDEPQPVGDPFTALLDRLEELGGVELTLPARATPARAPDFD